MTRWGAVVLAASALVLGTAYGTVAAIRAWFPHPEAVAAFATYEDLRLYWRNDLGIEPDRHLVPALTAGDAFFRAARLDLAAPGMTLIAGLLPHRAELHGAVLLDREGRELHYWPVDYSMLAPDGVRPSNVLLHGLALLPDGSIVVAFDNGDALARVDPCGNPVWTQRGSFHHSVTAGEDGSLWTWRDHSIVQVDAATGADLHVIDLERDVIAAQGLEGVLAMRTVEDPKSVVYAHDPFHPNDVEPLPAAYADAFPLFEAGDLLISLRELSFVGVVDARTGAVKWWSHGPWFKQHDPDFLPDGRISVYDNRMGLGGARILAIDPVTRVVETTLADAPELPFSSWRRGKHQPLANGNLLVVESERGRVFEATADGMLVWEYENRFDDERNAVVTSADRIDDGYVLPGSLRCDERFVAQRGE